MQENCVINIGRQLGSGGRLIGERLAKKLNFSFYDKELILLASKESGLCPSFFEQADEKSRFGISAGLFGLRASSLFDAVLADNYLNNEMLFQIQSNVIRKLAEQQSCVFVGRCADYILREHPHCVNIFITSDLEDRKKQLFKRPEFPQERIEDLLEKADKKRAGYYNYYTGKQWGAAESYHLCINSSMLGVDGTVGFIEHFVRQRQIN
jgi:cytidylate kinase